jgi:hypothetical protein
MEVIMGDDLNALKIAGPPSFPMTKAIFLCCYLSMPPKEIGIHKIYLSLII